MKLAALSLGIWAAVHSLSAQPQISPNDIVNAAGRTTGPLAPGEIIELFPQRAGPEQFMGAHVDGGRVSTAVGETRVLFDGIAAPVLYGIAGQLRAIVPYAMATRMVTHVVVEEQGVASVPVTLPVAESAPALFTLNGTGQGQAAMLNEAGCCNSPEKPAARGTVAALFATGAGETTPAGIDGLVAVYPRLADFPAPKLPLRVTVGGEKSEILWAGNAPDMSAGSIQVNFRVPLHAPLGSAVPVVLTVGSATSLDGVTMAVRSSVQQVLVLGLEPANRRWLKRVLTGAGYEVSTVAEVAELHPVDLVIAGLAIDPAEMREAIRKLRERNGQMRLIVVAAARGPRTLKEADLLEAQAVLVRPMTTHTLLKRVQALLGPPLTH